MELLSLGPGVFRARYDAGPDVLFFACESAEAEGLARELEHAHEARGALVGIDRWEPGGWRPCRLQAVLPFPA